MQSSPIINEIKREDVPEREPLVSALVSSSSSKGKVQAETFGGSIPQSNHGEMLVFTIKVRVNRGPVLNRMTQDIIENLTRCIHHDVTDPTAEIILGIVNNPAEES